MLSKTSCRSALGLVMPPPLVGMPRMGASRLRRPTCYQSGMHAIGLTASSNGIVVPHCEQAAAGV